MKMTSLCYLEQNGKYLMLHRTKKSNDENHNKWIGIGGKFEKGESPEDCMRREVLEETGFTIVSWKYCGIVTFVSDIYPCEYMHLFKCSDWKGQLIECNEGELEWIDKGDLYDLTLWEGDRIFLKLIENDNPFFSLKLCYHGENLISAELNGLKYQNDLKE